MLTLTEYADRKGVSRQYICKLLKDKRIKGARKVRSAGVKGGWLWMIPKAAKIA
jgi:GTP-sensing pleiotropic transcriptional regulator CodY